VPALPFLNSEANTSVTRNLDDHGCSQLHAGLASGGIRLKQVAEQFLRDEEGQDVVEYGLLIATIAIVVLVATQAFGTQIAAWFDRLAGRITTTAT
jgi:pilus assembly protein Flp/PilA